MIDVFKNVINAFVDVFPSALIAALITYLIYVMLPKKYCIWDVDENFVYDSFVTYPIAWFSLKLYSFLSGRNLELVKKEKK